MNEIHATPVLGVGLRVEEKEKKKQRGGRMEKKGSTGKKAINGGKDWDGIKIFSRNKETLRGVRNK